MKVKKKKKNEFGYFYQMSPGDPKKNIEVFNKNMTPNTSTEAPAEVSGGLTEARKKNVYEVKYLTRDSEDPITTYIDAYSEKQAAVILRKSIRGIYRIISIVLVENNEDGEQLSLFEEKSKTNISKIDKDVLFSYMKGTDIKSENQIALRNYLCQNRLNKNDDSSLVVHHIDNNHSNYKDSNLALIPKGDHSKIHNEAKTFAINTCLDNKGLLTKEDRDTFDAYNDLTDEDTIILIDSYRKKLTELCDLFRVDK